MNDFNKLAGGKSLEQIIDHISKINKSFGDMILKNKEFEMDNNTLQRSIDGGMLSDEEYKKEYKNAIDGFKNRSDYGIGDVVRAFQNIEQKDFKLSSENASKAIEVLKNNFLSNDDEKKKEVINIITRKNKTVIFFLFMLFKYIFLSSDIIFLFFIDTKLLP